GVELAALEAGEIVARRAAARYPGEQEYTFRHALVREAAYRMLPDDDRARSHRLAARWLERAGERDALVCAEHLERGGDLAAAVGWYARAAQQALEASDLKGAVERAEKAIAAGATGELYGSMRRLQAYAHWWRGDSAAAAAAGREAIRLLAAGSAGWYRAVRDTAAACRSLGQLDEVSALARSLDAPPLDEEAAATRLACASAVACSLFECGRLEQGSAILAAIGDPEATSDPALAGTLHYARA